MTDPFIVTHTHPDWDAITGVWLLKTYGGLQDCEIRFVNTGNPGPDVLKNATAVVDTGKEHDPERLRFDHHQLEGETARGTCATWQVFEHIRSQGAPVTHLAPLVLMIMAGDTGSPDYGADFSRKVGIHAILGGYRMDRSEGADFHRYLFGAGLLDHIDRYLKNRLQARESLKQHVVYRSDDNMVWGIQNGGEGATFAAFDEGARLVVFTGDSDGDLNTNAIGIMRSGEWNHPHVGELVEHIIETFRTDPEAYIQEVAELTTWFLHPAGFFAGRGTRKAPDPRPITVNLTAIAYAVDKMWERG
jgi:hypothetical protein